MPNDLNELITLLRSIRPEYGDIGSRDMDVAAQRQRIDRAIALLSRYGAQPAASAEPFGWVSERYIGSRLDGTDMYHQPRFSRERPLSTDRNVVALYAAPVAAQAQPCGAGELPDGYVAIPRQPTEADIIALAETLPEDTYAVDVWGTVAGRGLTRSDMRKIGAALAQQCDAGEICLDCQPRNADGSCPDAPQGQSSGNSGQLSTAEPSGNSGELPDALVPAAPDIEYLRGIAHGSAAPALLRGNITSALRWIDTLQTRLAKPQPAQPMLDWIRQWPSLTDDMNIKMRAAWNAGHHAAMLAAQAASKPAQAERIPYENFPCYLIDQCEGEIITEEFLHRALERMLVNPKYAALSTPPADDDLRQRVGEAITDYMAGEVEDGVFSIDPFDSRNIDPIIDAAIAAMGKGGEHG